MSTDKAAFQVKRLNEGDLFSFRALIHLFQEVFEMEEIPYMDDAYLCSLLARQSFVALAIIHEQEIIGGLTAWELQMYYGKYKELFIYDVGVKDAFRRKGLGHRLLSALRDWCRENGVREFFVPAHEQDTHALEFYRSAGGEEEKVVHFKFPVK
jgi:aminoglycoside 3-N-acetyltransferase I